MEGFLVRGGERICGTMHIAAAKNAVLPIMAASILPGEPVNIIGCPQIGDVESMRGILKCLGCTTRWTQEGLLIDSTSLCSGEMPEYLSKRIRSSIFLLGPILGRLRRATMVYPGGCEIGLRPIDLHLNGLRRMGVEIREAGGVLHCDGSRMHAGDIHLDYPSVGATENVMMAAVLLPGRTTISNAAREPEIEDLQNYINAMGGRIHGAGSQTIVIEAGDLCRMGADIHVSGRAAFIRGVEELHGVHTVARDLRGGAALVLAGLRAQGETLIEGVELIDRGYEKMEEQLKRLGADICRVQLPDA